MDNILDNIMGIKFEITSPKGTWKQYREEIAADLKSLYSSFPHPDKMTFEYWTQGHFHDIAPGMMTQVQENRIAILYMGAGSEVLWPKIDELIVKWQKEYDDGLEIKDLGREKVKDF